MQVLWGTVGNYGVLQVLEVLGDTGGQKRVLHNTSGYYQVLGGTGCTGWYLLVQRVLGRFGSTVGYQRVLA